MSSRIADDPSIGERAKEIRAAEWLSQQCSCREWKRSPDGVAEYLVRDPNCKIHPQPSLACGLIGFLDLSEVNWAGLCTEADIDAGRGR